MEIPILRDLLVLITVSLGVVYLFQKLRLPPVVGFLLTGVLLGPGGLALIQDTHEIEILAEIGVVLLLFTIGLEFSLTKLARMKWLVLGGGALQMGSTLLVACGIAFLLGRPLSESIFWGMLFALSSTAIVLKLLGERGEIDAPHGQVMVGVLLFQDLAVVPLMLFAPVLSGQGTTVVELTWAMLTSFGTVGLILLGANFIFPWLLERVVKMRIREVFVLMTLLVALGTAWVTAEVGLSLALGAFLAGLIISESPYSHQMMTEVLPFRDVASSLFFISIGMLVYPLNWWADPLKIGLLLLLVLLIKASLAGLVALVFGYGIRIAILVGLGLAQVGEFAFILANFGLGYQLLDADQYQLFLSISVLTMLLTPFAFLLSPRLAGAAHRVAFLEKLVWGKRGQARQEQEEQPGKPLQEHVIVVGYGINGRNVTRVLKHSQIPYVILELNSQTVSTMRKEGEPIFYGDATRQDILEHAKIKTARVLVVAIADPASTRQIVSVSHALNPSLTIAVRTRFVGEIEELYRLGATEVVPEEFETSLELLSRVLYCYGVDEGTIFEQKNVIRQEHYALLLGTPPRHSVSLETLVTEESLCLVHLEEGEPVLGKTLAELDLRQRSGVFVLALRRAGKFSTHPDQNTPLALGDTLVLLGSASQLENARTLLEGVEH